MKIGRRHAQNIKHHNLLWHYCFQWQGKLSLNSSAGSIRDSFIFFHLKGLRQSGLSKCETRTVKMENDYTCQVGSVNITAQSSFGLWMWWCVAIMAPEQRPQGGGERRGKVINCLGCNGGSEWAVPRAPREPAWTLDGLAIPTRDEWCSPWTTHTRPKEHLSRKMVRSQARECAIHQLK